MHPENTSTSTESLARAVRHVASATASHDPKARSTDPGPADTARRPLFERLEPSLRFVDDDERRPQPKIGASAAVGAGLWGQRDAQTVWLSAAAWQGIGFIVQQTPRHLRPSVVDFLTVLHAAVPSHGPISGLLAEVIRDLEQDPYADVRATGRGDFDFVWD